MKAVWLEQYPRGIRAEIELNEYSSLNDLAARSCAKHSDLIAWRQMGSAMSYRELDEESAALAAYLQSLPGVPAGSRVAIMLPNILQYPVAMLAVLRAGLVIVNFNPLYTARELESQLRDSGARVLIVVENFAHVAEKVLPSVSVQHVITTGIGDLLPFPRRLITGFVVKRVKRLVPPWNIAGAVAFRKALRQGRGMKFSEAEPRQSDVALLQYTGGTTGIAKGAVLTHGNLLANALQLEEWCRGVLREGREVWLVALPLYHINSFLISFLNIKIGGCGLLIANPRDVAGMIRELRRTPPTTVTGVNTLFNALLNAPGFAELDFSRLRFVAGGAAPIHPAVAERWRTVTSRPITQGYGLTESSAVATVNLPGAPFNGTVGLPLPSTEVSIRDDDGRELPFDMEGEICLRGPQIMRGYWQRPEETAAAFTSDGWFRTGDIGALDRQGYLRITDRKKDIINVSGFKVFPGEVEAVICSFPGVLECGVVGADDGIGGEVVRAVVQPSSSGVTAEALMLHCRKHLTSYKVPKIIEFQESLPKSPVGKILRRELRQKPR